MKATRPSFFVSSILFSQSGWTKSSAFAIPHERSDSTFAQSITITKLSSPRAVNYLSLRGGDGRNVDIISRNVINPAVASLVAGSVAGAIGVGVAFPLDTLKTKSQVLASSQRSGGIQTDPSSGTASLLAGEDVTQMNMFELFALIYKMEGIGGFYGGVKGMMVGQGKCTHYTIHTSKLHTHRYLLLKKLLSGYHYKSRDKKCCLLSKSDRTFGFERECCISSLCFFLFQ